MRIILLTQYFPPETGAPQNRLWALARHLDALDDTRVEVLTAMPNYPVMRVMDGYRGKFYTSGEMDGITVHRSWIYVTRSGGVLARLLNYFSFVISSLIIGAWKLGRADVLICESPPLFLGISAWSLSRMKGARFVFNVSDLWPESAEKLGIVSNRFLLSGAYRLEAFLYRRSALTSCQTRGIEQNIRKRFPAVDTCWLPNGADLERFVPGSFGRAWRMGAGFPDEEVLVLYAGIVGHAQGLDLILDAAKQVEGAERVRFLILGDGPEKARLRKRIDEEGITGVSLLDAVPKESMPAILDAVDAVLVPLKPLELFKGAIPSKIFEALAMEKPVLLGVEGEAFDLFVTEAGAALPFRPGDAADLVRALNRLLADPEMGRDLGRKGRDYVSRHFDRKAISLDFHRRLLDMLGSPATNR